MTSNPEPVLLYKPLTCVACGQSLLGGGDQFSAGGPGKGLTSRIFTKVLPRASLPPLYLPSYLPIYLPTYLPIHLSTYLPTYISTYLPTYLPHYLPTCVSSGPGKGLTSRIFTKVLPTPPLQLPTYLLTYLPTYLPSYLGS